MKSKPGNRKKSFFENNSKIRAELLRWLQQKKLGKSATERSAFLNQLDNFILNNDQLNEEFSVKLKPEKHVYKSRLETFNKAASTMQMAIESLQRSPQAATELSMAMAHEEGRIWSIDNVEQLELSLRDCKQKLFVLSNAALSVKKRHSQKSETRQFLYRYIAVIASLWRCYLGEEPSPSDRGVFKQFLEKLNNSLDGSGFAKFPTNSRGIEKAIKQF